MENTVFVLPSYLKFIFCCILITGLVNAINWIDGLDGLLSGYTLIASSFIEYKFYIRGAILLQL